LILFREIPRNLSFLDFVEFGDVAITVENVIRYRVQKPNLKLRVSLIRISDSHFIHIYFFFLISYVFCYHLKSELYTHFIYSVHIIFCLFFWFFWYENLKSQRYTPRICSFHIFLFLQGNMTGRIPQKGALYSFDIGSLLLLRNSSSKFRSTIILTRSTTFT